MGEFALPLLGGVLIGLASLGLLLFLGRIAGISGITWSAVSRPAHAGWQWMFLVGLLAGAWLFHAISGVSYPTPSPLSPWQAIVAGLLVGIGVKLGSGCTSGHGVCGIGRLSLRSFTATLTFMAFGIAAVFVVRHLIG